MAKRRAYSTRERIDQLAASGLTQTRIAERIGVSTRTLRRWRNQGKEPSPAKAKAVSRLAHEATNARQANKRKLERQGIRPPPGATIMPPGRRLNKRIETPKGVEYRPGKITELNTEGLSLSAILDLLWPYRDQALIRGRRQRREPGSFRFIVRELAKRKPLKAGAARGGPRHSTYVTRLMREKENVQHRKPRDERQKVGAIYMTRQISWTAVLTDEELEGIIAQAAAGKLGGGGWRVEIIGVRIYPPGL